VLGDVGRNGAGARFECAHGLRGFFFGEFIFFDVTT
jgi:hypothetical protein